MRTLIIVVSICLLIVIISAPRCAGATEAADALTDSVPSAVERALSDEVVSAVVERTSDAETLLGLAMLTSNYETSFSPQGVADFHNRDVCKKAVAKALAARPGSAFAYVVMRATGVEPSKDDFAGLTDSLIKDNPANALGYYLKAAALYHQKKDDEARAILKQGLVCRVVYTHDAEGRAAVVRGVSAALDALGLKDPERICAVSGVSRSVPPAWYCAGGMADGILIWKYDMGIPETDPVWDDVSEWYMAVAGQIGAQEDIGSIRSNAQFWALDWALRLKSGLVEKKEPAKAKAFAALVELIESKVGTRENLLGTGGGYCRQALDVLFSPAPEVESAAEDKLLKLQTARDRFLSLLTSDDKAFIEAYLCPYTDLSIAQYKKYKEAGDAFWREWTSLSAPAPGQTNEE